jgi:hypothetical protein
MPESAVMMSGWVDGSIGVTTVVSVIAAKWRGLGFAILPCLPRCGSILDQPADVLSEMGAECRSVCGGCGRDP